MTTGPATSPSSTSTGQLRSNELRFGDTLPDVPAGLLSPEQREARTFGPRLRELLLRLTHPRKAAPILPAHDQVSDLVVVQPGDLRDLVMLEPALRALRLRFVHARRTLFAPPDAAALFAGTAWGEVQPIDQLARFRPASPDTSVVVDMTQSADSARAKQLRVLGFSHRVGVDLAGRGVYFTISLPPADGGTYRSDAYLQLSEAIGAPAWGDAPSLPHGPDRLRRGRQHWIEELDHPAPVLLLPGWENQPYGWPLETFSHAGARLRGRGLCVLTRLPGDRGHGRDLAQRLGCQHREVSDTRELMDRLASASLVIGNDGGTLHLATALGVPVIMFAITPVPWRSWPRAEGGAVVFRAQDEMGRIRFDRVEAAEVAAAGLALLEG